MMRCGIGVCIVPVQSRDLRLAGSFTPHRLERRYQTTDAVYAVSKNCNVRTTRYSHLLQLVER